MDYKKHHIDLEINGYHSEHLFGNKSKDTKKDVQVEGFHSITNRT